MDEWVALLLPFALVFARTTAFVVILPILGSESVPAALKAGVGLLLSVFFAGSLPAVGLAGTDTKMLGAAVLLVREALCGLALGVAANLIFNAIGQGGAIIGREMGFYIASTIDPTTGEEVEPFGQYLEMIFTLLFLAAGGHHLLLRVLARSYQVLPVLGPADFGALAAGVLAAGSAMFLFALKLAAPVLAAFLILAVVLGVLARILPEMDILMTSLPLRVGLGLLIATVMVPMVQTFVDDVSGWLSRFL